MEVLSAEQVASIRRIYDGNPGWHTVCPLCDSHEELRAQVAALESMFDNDNPEAVNTLAANIQRNLSDERIEALLRGLSERYSRMDALEADIKKYKPDFEGCLNCGAKEPCDLDKMETANDPNWPGSPCMFDPTPRQIFDAFQLQRKRADALEAELAVEKRAIEVGEK